MRRTSARLGSTSFSRDQRAEQAPTTTEDGEVERRARDEERLGLQRLCAAPVRRCVSSAQRRRPMVVRAVERPPTGKRGRAPEASGTKRSAREGQRRGDGLDRPAGDDHPARLAAWPIIEHEERAEGQADAERARRPGKRTTRGPGRPPDPTTRSSRAPAAADGECETRRSRRRRAHRGLLASCGADVRRQVGRLRVPRELQRAARTRRPPTSSRTESCTA